MKLSTIISLTALGASAASAFPLLGFRARAELDERDLYAPAVRNLLFSCQICLHCK